MGSQNLKSLPRHQQCFTNHVRTLAYLSHTYTKVTYYSLFDGGFCLIGFFFHFPQIFTNNQIMKSPPSHTYQHTYKAYLGRKSLRNNPWSVVSDDLVIFEYLQNGHFDNTYMTRCFDQNTYMTNPSFEYLQFLGTI